MTTGPLHTARSIPHDLDELKKIIFEILIYFLRMFPYLFQQVQALELGDNQQHVDFTKFFFIKYEEDSRGSFRIIWTDKALFTLTENLNSMNYVHWGKENPYSVGSMPLYVGYVTVLCGVSGAFILCPYFFEDVIFSDMQTCSITGAWIKQCGELRNSRNAATKCH